MIEVLTETKRYSKKLLAAVVISFVAFVLVTSFYGHLHFVPGRLNGARAGEHNIIPITFKWRDLNMKELQEWYRPIDFCMLSSNSSFISTKSHFLSKCSSGNGDSGSRSYSNSSGSSSSSSDFPPPKKRQVVMAFHDFCGPGMGSRGTCPSPLTKREFFFRALQGYDQAADRPLVELSKSLYAHHQELIFIGDSLMRQNVLSFLCELRREGVSVKTSHMDTNCHHVYTIRGQNPLGGVVVVANIGVWYNDEAVYEEEVGEFLQWMHADVGLAGGEKVEEDSKLQGHTHHRRSLAVFLESFPQHTPVPRPEVKTGRHGLSTNSDSDAGRRNNHRIHYSVPSSLKEILVAEKDKACCVPITNYSPLADWRNRIAREVTARSGYHSVSILPVAEAFKPAHSMLTCGVNKSDCTHYCFWPMQLQFEWHALAKIVKQQCVGAQCV